MCKNLFLMLKNGKNNKKYSNFHKNIDTKIKSMRLAWESISKNIPIHEFIRNNPIGMTKLKEYRKYYKDNG
jgi:hypothetical protein